MVFHWSLSDNVSTQVSRTLLSILDDLNSLVVWTVFIRPLISMSSSPCTNPLVPVPRVPISIGINVTFMFRSFFNSREIPRYSSFFSICFSFTQFQPELQSPQFLQVLFFFIIISSGRLTEIKWSVCKSKSQRSLCVSSSRTDVGLNLTIRINAISICLYGQIQISCTIPSGSLCLPIRVWSYTLSELICSVRLNVIDGFVSTTT